MQLLLIIQGALACLFLGSAAVAAQEQLRGSSLTESNPSPTWPNVFQISFNETVDYVILKGHTNGTTYYDWNNVKERTDRESVRFRCL